MFRKFAKFSKFSRDASTLYAGVTLEERVAAFFGNGHWSNVSDISTLFQSFDGTTPVTSNGDPIGYFGDVSGNDIPATQSVSPKRPTYQSDANGGYAEFDQSDDQIEIEIPAGGLVGTMVMGFRLGSFAAEVDLSAGTYTLGQGQFGLYLPDDELVGVILVEGGLSPAQEQSALAYLESKGAGGVEGLNVPDLNKKYRELGLTLFDASKLTNATDCRSTWFGNKLTSFDSSGLISGTNFKRAWGANSLISFDGSGLASLANPGFSCFFRTWTDGANALNAASVESILTNIAASGAHAPAFGKTIDIWSDGSPLTTAASNAVTTLKSRGWEPTVDGVAL